MATNPKQTTPAPKLKLSSKTKASDFAANPVDGGKLDLDPEMREHLKAEGLAPRWINKKKYFDDGNFHASGWVPFRLSDEFADAARRGTIDFKYGVSPEGFVIRGDSILAVMPETHRARRRKMLDEKSQRMSQVNRAKADELRQFAKDHRVKNAQVFEGWEENDGEAGDDE